jgi:ribonuclease HI
MNITIFTDSQYIAKAINEGWLRNWIATQFKGGKKNKDLWMRFHELSQKNKLNFVWVKGHADNPLNNRCDELATGAADGNGLLIDEEYEKDKNSLFE